MGNTVQFEITIDYLGQSDDRDTYDSELKPAVEEFTDDIVVLVDGDSLADTDDLNVDINQTAFEGRTQVLVTKPFYLERSGHAELQIGGANPYTTGYTFEIRDLNLTVVNWLVALLTLLVGLVVGFFIGRV